MSFQTHCDQYIQNINDTRFDPNATPELSLHPYLKTFLENVTDDCFKRSDVRYTLEPKNINQTGRPDFIATDGLLPIGYIEAEADGADLNNLKGHAKKQNDRFKQNLDNFILTNFTDFQLWIDGKCIVTARITDNIDDLKALLQKFLDTFIQIGTPEALARYLARRTRELRIQIQNALTVVNSNTRRMYTAFQKTLLPTLTQDSFADMYAQTLAYGLLAARCTLSNATDFSRHTAASILPDSNPFLKDLFYHVAAPRLEANINYILENIEILLQHIPTDMLHSAFTTKNPLEDPVVHFYETFLKEYNPKLRFERGVFYTPPQVISYIVRSVDSLLKTELNKQHGLADDNTLILDPATGTGGFLFSALDHIQDYVSTTEGTGSWNLYVNDNLVKRIFGFELLVASYTIAHLKLGLFLKDQGWHADERLRIYLTNTLELPADAVDTQPFAPFISDEANEALSVKRDQPILAIIGNPPYPENSENPSRDSDGELTFIGRLIEDYKQLDGKPLDEKNVKSLQSDYVKFIRWAQWRIDRNGEGVLGYIVNNSFLCGPTFRGMRYSLLNSFNTIYILNLHGSIRIQERVPDGEKDKNVFDISQGVCILLCVKERNKPELAKIYYSDMWGNRKEKYRKLSENNVQSTEWSELQPESHQYFFVPYPTGYSAEYDSGWKVPDIFINSIVGIVTGRDKLTIHQTTAELKETVTDFVSLSVEEARERYNLGKDTEDWKVHLAQADIRNHLDSNQHIKPIHYRAFDARWTYYTGQTKGFHQRPRLEIMRHLFEENVALSVCRIVTSRQWQHALITDIITDKCCISNRGSESGHVFPLYLYPNPEGSLIDEEIELNIKPEFLTALSQALQLPQTGQFQLPEGITPEQILAYIYAILYSPTYRDRYYEFLRYDFPRIPLPPDIDQFRTLASLGQKLIDLHLLNSVPTTTTHRFEGEGENVVGKVRYEGGNIWINDTHHFTDVPQEVWEYEIGAYQVCHKWLKDRKDTTLTIDDVRQYRSILIAIAETIRIMDTIDATLW